tara:strand:- start:9 stop:461 length:453 start_codon:yes stop_codon:yes gene_type:complete
MLNTQATINPVVAEIDLDRIIWKVSNNQYKPEMTEDDILRAVKQYRRFLSLKIAYPSVNLVPTDDIDLIWHTHILDTVNYAADCQKLFGTFLNHYPYFGDFGHETQEEMSDMFSETSELWIREYGEVLETPEIFRCAGKACHAPSNCRCR